MPLRIQSRVARGVRAYPQLQAVARGLLAVASAFGKYPQLLAAARGSLRISSAAGGGGSSAAGDGLRSVENIFSCWRWPEGFVRGCPQLLAADRRGWPRIGGGQSAQPSPARPSPALAALHRLHFSCGLIFADGHTTSDLFRPPKLILGWGTAWEDLRVLSAFLLLATNVWQTLSPRSNIFWRGLLVLELLSCSFWASLPWAWQFLQKATQGNLLCRGSRNRTLGLRPTLAATLLQPCVSTSARQTWIPGSWLAR